MIIQIAAVSQPFKSKSKASKDRRYTARNLAQCHPSWSNSHTQKRNLALKIKLPQFMQKFKWV